MAKTTKPKTNTTEAENIEQKQTKDTTKTKVSKSKAVSETEIVAKAVTRASNKIKKTTSEIEKIEKKTKPVVISKSKKIDVPAKVTSNKKIELKNIEPQILMPVIHEENIEKETPIREKKTTVRYSDKDLEIFRSVIEMNRMEALDELRMLEERIEDLNQSDVNDNMVYSDHMGEQGSESMEKEKAYAQRQRISEYIQKLNEAMVRIEDKSYGVCRMCNCLIAKERLLAVPITTLSASWKIHQKCPVDGIDKIESIIKNKK